MRRAPQQPSIHMTQQMTTNVAPAYDGRNQFLCLLKMQFDDWCDITELEPEKRGPALRNRLEGEASQYKRLLNRRVVERPKRWCELFQEILATSCHQGSPNSVLILYRFMQLIQYNRGPMDLQKWMTRFQLTGNRLIESRSNCICCPTSSRTWRTSS